MCIKQYLGYICGHCSIPELIRCPLTAQNPVYPPCVIPGERPIQTNENCHPCLRVLWNQKVLAEEEEHRQAHLRNECLCEVVFDGEDKEYRAKLAKEQRAKQKGKGRANVANAFQDPNYDPQAASEPRDNGETSYKSAERTRAGNDSRELVYKFVRGGTQGVPGQQSHGHQQAEPSRDHHQDTRDARRHSHHGGRGMLQARGRGNYTNIPRNSHAGPPGHRGSPRNHFALHHQQHGNAQAAPSNNAPSGPRKDWENKPEESARAYAGYYIDGLDYTRNKSQSGHQQPNVQAQAPFSPTENHNSGAYTPEQSHGSTVGAVITPGSNYQAALLPQQQPQGYSQSPSGHGYGQQPAQYHNQPSTYVQSADQGYAQNPASGQRQSSREHSYSSSLGNTQPTNRGHPPVHPFNQPYNQAQGQFSNNNQVQPQTASTTAHIPTPYHPYTSYPTYTGQLPPSPGQSSATLSFTPYIGQPLFGQNPYSDPNFNPPPIIGYGPTPYRDFFPWERVHPDQLMIGQVGAGVRYYIGQEGGVDMGGNAGGYPPLPPRLEGVPMFDEGPVRREWKGKSRSEPAGDVGYDYDAGVGYADGEGSTGEFYGGENDGESSPDVLNFEMGTHASGPAVARGETMTPASTSSSLELGPEDVSSNIDTTEHEASPPIITSEMASRKSP
ncbi:hypothetical protein B0J14DRAFT_561399 [Halenospora varia]|nr:hypothetical protein B0J14DRAFT_561399 [Halenospora varia]